MTEERRTREMTARTSSMVTRTSRLEDADRAPAGVAPRPEVFEE